MFIELTGLDGLKKTIPVGNILVCQEEAGGACQLLLVGYFTYHVNEDYETVKRLMGEAVEKYKGI